MNRAQIRRSYQDLFEHQRHTLVSLLARCYQHIDQLYEDQLLVLVTLATLAHELAYPVGLHLLPEEEQSPDWRTLLVIDLPAGQICFPVPDAQIPLFRGLPHYAGKWQGYPDQIHQRRLLTHPGCMSSLTEEIPAVYLPVSHKESEDSPTI